MAKKKSTKATATNIPSADQEVLNATCFLTQAMGIVETVIALNPVASQLNNGEIARALWGAVDQLERALVIVDVAPSMRVQS